MREARRLDSLPFVLHDHPDEAVREKIANLQKLKKDKGLVQLDSGHKLTAYQYTLRKYCQTDWWFLARAVLNYHWIDEDLHGRTLMRHYFRKDPDTGLYTDAFDKATLIPRGHVKTLFLGCSRQIFRMLREPSSTILYASATIKLAQDVGLFISEILLGNPYLQAAFPDILPANPKDCSQWGIRGYRLPGQVSPDPTLVSASLDTNVTGRHPLVIVLDDLIVEQTNNALGYAKATQFIKNCLALLPPHGFFEYLATRWDDGDTSADIISGAIRGKQGPFQTLVLSCWENDDEKKGKPIWPAAKRWNSTTVSGYTAKQLLDMKHTMGTFFNAQYRNDPAPAEDQAINIKDINVYKPEEAPTTSTCRALGIEMTGGGQLIYQLVVEKAQALNIKLPLVQIQNPKRGRSGLTKEDDIVTELEPIIREGRLHVLSWMLSSHEHQQDTLGYEIQRLGAARHDDIADALHNCVKHLVRRVTPGPTQEAHLYISCDLAFTESSSSDFSVLLALAVDHKANHYVLDYERFRIASPTGIVDRIIAFHQKHSQAKPRRINRRTRSFATNYR